MIDIPEISEGRALAAIDVSTIENGKFVWCTRCYFFNQCDQLFACRKRERKDGKNVIFKLVDYQPQG